MSRQFSVLGELQRYGLHSRDILYCILWAAVALALTIFVPPGQGKYVFQYLTFHLAALGFGAAIFSRTILGRDDFFKSVCQDALRNFVLCLFFPLILHGLSCFALMLWIIFPGSFSQGWRFVYGYLAVFAVAQSAFSFRALFILAITRLTHQGKQESIMFPPPPPILLDPKSVDQMMTAKGKFEETIANDLWDALRPFLLSGNNRSDVAGIVIRTLEKHGWDKQGSPLLIADYTGELPDESSHVFELCQYETCRQPATWSGFLECEGVIPVCNQCVVDVEDPVLI